MQYNDPDPLRWMVVYGIGAAWAGLAAARGAVPVRPVLAWAAVTFAAGLLDLSFGTGQVEPMGGFPYWSGPGGDALRDEIVREVLGLWLMSGWMGILAVWTRQRNRAS